MLKDPGLSSVYLAVDALDECDKTEPGLMQLLGLISKSFTICDKVRWLLSSRPEVHVLTELGLDNSVLGNSVTPVELDPQRLADPVNTYINRKLTKLKGRSGYDDSVLSNLSTEFCNRAMNTFLWVALAFKSLQTKNQGIINGHYALERIKEMPPGLMDLYNHLAYRLQEIETVRPQDCKEVLAAAIIAFRPLSLAELASIVDLSPDVTEVAVEECASFLTMRKNTVSLIHQSAREYLVKNFQSFLEKAGIPQAHVEMGKRSIKVMSSILTRNMYNLNFEFKPQDVQLPGNNPLASVRYSCIYWVDHLCYVHGRPAQVTGVQTRISRQRRAV